MSSKFNFIFALFMIAGACPAVSVQAQEEVAPVPAPAVQAELPSEPSPAGLVPAGPPFAAAPAAVMTPADAITPKPQAGVVSPLGSATTAPSAAVPAPVMQAMESADDVMFPRYAALKPAVSFWTRVFGEYSEFQSVIHSSRYPNKVYEVLDFRGDALRMDRYALARLRDSGERRSKVEIDTLLAQVHALRATPEKMTAAQRRVYDMFADVKGDDRFSQAVGSFRAQRGLKERTASALEISGGYLPEMEHTFSRYELPIRLTRLPLVESSFNVEAYSKVGAAGLWQFMPSSARIYMRLNELVDDRRDPWFSTDAAARHLRDDYRVLKSWPLALTAYNHGRSGVASALKKVGGTTLADLVDHYESPRFGFASRNFYTEFLAAADVERNWRDHFGQLTRQDPLRFDVVETRHYVPYETLRKLCGVDDSIFRKLNPAYRPEVMEGKLYVPPGHLIRVPAGRAQSFQTAYAQLGQGERFDTQRVYYSMYKVQRGDSLAKVAKRYGIAQSAVLQTNGLNSSSKLRAGQVLRIPPRTGPSPVATALAARDSTPDRTRTDTRTAQLEPIKSAVSGAASAARTHKVKSGQTLGSIAHLYSVSITELRQANKLGSSSHIRIGQQLKIPAG